MELDFLEGPQGPQDAAPAPQPDPQTPEPASDGQQPRDETGRFAATETPPAEPAQEPQAPAPVAPVQAEPQAAPVPAAPPPGYVPVTALQELRAEIRALKQTPQEAVLAPDLYEDPEGYAAYQNLTVQTAIRGQAMLWSRKFAESQYKPEDVAQAHEWGVQKCDEDPYFNQRVAASQDPYGVVMEEWKREQLLSKFQPSDYDQFLAWKAAQGSAPAPIMAAPAAPPTPVPPPPRSLASVSSAAGKAAPDPGSAYDGIFEKG